jgi:histidinol phosphatase-like PHP family hydrolase
MTKKEQQGLNIIYGHTGKRQVYETFKRNDPELAQKYLEFISKNQTAIYIKWDAKKKQFTS